MIKFDFNCYFRQKSLHIKARSPAFCIDSVSMSKLKKGPILELYLSRWILSIALCIPTAQDFSACKWERARAQQKKFPSS